MESQLITHLHNLFLYLFLLVTRDSFIRNNQIINHEIIDDKFLSSQLQFYSSPVIVENFCVVSRVLFPPPLYGLKALVNLI